MDPGQLFEDVEFSGYKDTRTPDANNKYKAETTVRKAARKVWEHRNTNRQELGEALQAYYARDRSLTRLLETYPDPIGSETFEQYLVRQCGILTALESLQQALNNLIPARRSHALGQVGRTVSYLQQRQTATDTASRQFRPSFTRIVRDFRNDYDRLVRPVPGSLAEVPEETETFQNHLASCFQALDVLDNFDTELRLASDRLVASTERNSSRAAGYLNWTRVQLARVIANLKRRIGEHRPTLRGMLNTLQNNAVAPSEEDPNVEAIYVQYLQNLHSCLARYKIQMKSSVKVADRDRHSPTGAGTLAQMQNIQKRIQAQYEKNLTELHIHTSILKRLQAEETVRGSNAAQKEERRLQAGRLKHGWIAVGGDMSGMNGKVQVWVKQDHQGIIIDRIAIKDGAGRNVEENEPLEVTCMQTLQGCEDTGTMVRLLNWRMDPEKLEKNPDLIMAYRLYLEYCGRGDLEKVIKEYGVHPYDDQSRQNWIPKPFVWFVLETLAKAACVMKNGNLDSPEAKDPKWKFIVHGDIKPENIFLGENTSDAFLNYPQPKLGDFGLAHQDPYHGAERLFNANDYDADQWRPIGTPYWRAPEQVVNDKEHRMWLRDQIKSATDVWAIGLTIWALIKLRTIPDNVKDWENMAPNETRVPSGFTKEEVKFYGRNLCRLTMNCLKFMPRERISIEKLLEYVKVFSDETHATREMTRHDPKWVEHFVKAKYDKWARGTVLEQWLEERDKQGVPKHAFVPPRKRKRSDSEDYGGRQGKDLVIAAGEAAKNRAEEISKE